MHVRIVSHLKCSSAVSTHQWSPRLRIGAVSRCTLVTTGVVGRRQCTVMHRLSRVVTACQFRRAGFSHFQYRRPRATLPARYTALQICTTSVHTCPTAPLHGTPVRTARNVGRHQHWMLRRTAGKVFRAYLSRDLGTYLERRCGAWRSHWMSLWSCRLTTRSLHAKARWWIGSTTV